MGIYKEEGFWRGMEHGERSGQRVRGASEQEMRDRQWRMVRAGIEGKRRRLVSVLFKLFSMRSARSCQPTSVPSFPGLVTSFFQSSPELFRNCQSFNNAHRRNLFRILTKVG